ncbi:hypothetical protein DM860_014821 [Cuscuta australis]|uniref:NHL repeat-containing protein n=1 Tax=Cuscuta australis TaxID=267555 RepID=A0A328DI18_9ASTE|nr:hypothetical protein DM860_014821 [Cuscuta australis]
MRVSFFVLSLLAFFSLCLHFQAFAAAPAGPLGKQLKSLLKWTSRTSTKTPQSDGNVLQFEDGYLVETVVKGNELGVVPHKIRVSQDGELVAVDASSSNVVRITPPLSQYCRARLVAGSFKGHTGHVDGKPSDARFNNPRGVAMDDRGNVYVADVSNLAIRKIGDSGVTTIAGGKSNSAGYRDGPSDEAQFSNDFDVIYVQQTCSVLIVDRGNAAIRQISLYQEDCGYQQSSVSAIGMTPPKYESSVSGIGVVLVVFAVVTGYVACTLQQGIGSTIFSTAGNAEGEEDQRQQLIRREKASPVEIKNVYPYGLQGNAEGEEDQRHLLIRREIESPVVAMEKDDNQVVVGGWVSLGQLMLDLAKLSLEGVACIFALVIPLQFRSRRGRPSLTPLKDRLVLPEDSDNFPEHRGRAAAASQAAPPISRAVLQPPQSVGNIPPIQEARQSRRRSSKPQGYAAMYDAQTAEVQVPNQQLSRSGRSKSRHEKSTRKDSNQVGMNVPHSGVQSIDR